MRTEDVAGPMRAPFPEDRLLIETDLPSAGKARRFLYDQ